MRTSLPPRAAACVLLAASSGCSQRRALGEALRAPVLRRPHHVGRARPGVRRLHRPRVRGARRRARRHRQPWRRLRLQLRHDATAAHGIRPRCSPRRRSRCWRARGAGGRAAGRPCRRALPPLRRRRRDHRRPFGAGAQEIRREVLGLGQLLHGHGVQRVDRRDDHGQPVQGAAHAGQPRVRHAARQDAVQRQLHEQRRERLHGQHRQLRPQPGHVRRPHDGLVRLQPGLGRSAQARRQRVQRDGRPPQLPLRPVSRSSRRS